MPSILSFFLRTVLLLALLIGPVHSASAQDRDRVSRTVGAFTEVEFEIPGTLHLRQGEEQSIEIEARPAVLENVETTVDEEALKISTEGDSGLFDRLFGGGDLDVDQLDVYVTATQIERLAVAGSGLVVGETRLDAGTLTLNVAGSGGVDLEVDTRELEVHVAGSGTSTLRGQAEALTANIAGSGNLRAGKLGTQTAEIRIAGSGDVDLHVTDQLSAQIFGSGDVRYRGNPTIDQNLLGSGEVHSIE